MPRFFLIRHGDTASNSRERYWGSTDVHLSTEGIRQAERLRDRFAPEKVDAIYASDLQRAMKTARTIATRHKLDVISCPELRETDFGKIEGMKFDEISEQFPELVELWINWDSTMRFPDGESVTEVNQRVITFLDRLKHYTSDEQVLIVAHAATLRLLICHLLGIEIQHWRQLRLSLASLSIVEINHHEAVLTALNDVSHLE